VPTRSNAGALCALAAVGVVQSTARRLSSAATASLISVIDGDKTFGGVGGDLSPATPRTCNELPRIAFGPLAVARRCVLPLPASSHSYLITDSADSRSLSRLWSTTKVLSYINGGLLKRLCLRLYLQWFRARMLLHGHEPSAVRSDALLTPHTLHACT
jgi:hypothetical protein